MMSSKTLQRRKELLSRKGPYYNLDLPSGNVEFGATIQLITKLDEDSDENNLLISDWVSDEKQVARSIWDESLTTDLGDSVYRLQVMKLQFVTLELQPRVDIQIFATTRPSDGIPVIYLQSVNFDPQLSILPGMGSIDISSLNIVIDVAGQMAPDGKGGVAGRITFATLGQLPRLLRLVPQGILQAAAETICQTIAAFATESFQRGAKKTYQDFRSSITSRESGR
jgi:Protein of unknown function (DUF1997)